MRRVRRLQHRPGWAWSIAVTIVKPVLFATTRHHWTGGEKIPAEGGCVLVLNHLSHIDPLIVAHIVWDHGRIPRYLAKSGLFRNRFLAFWMRGLGQIPVERSTRNAAGAYAAAVEAVRGGECVVVYPEGTLTRDPQLWPMTGKTGAARIALETRCPVIPIGQWGAQGILAPYAKTPHLFPRTPVEMLVGDPVDLSDLSRGEPSAATISEATTRIMDVLTTLVAELRGEPAPTERFDPRRAGVPTKGNPDRSMSKEAS